jgi:hypothetical protein
MNISQPCTDYLPSTIESLPRKRSSTSCNNITLTLGKTRWPHVHDADRKEWHLWFQAQGIDDIGPPHGPAFDDSGVC